MDFVALVFVNLQLCYVLTWLAMFVLLHWFLLFGFGSPTSSRNDKQPSKTVRVEAVNPEWSWHFAIKFGFGSKDGANNANVYHGCSIQKDLRRKKKHARPGRKSVAVASNFIKAKTKGFGNDSFWAVNLMNLFSLPFLGKRRICYEYSESWSFLTYKMSVCPNVDAYAFWHD